MRLTAVFAVALLAMPLAITFAQDKDIPKNIADSVGRTMRYSQGQLLGLAEAMPESKYSYVPTGGSFQGVRSFADQVKHVACAHFAFFNEIEGKAPPEHCEKGGPSTAKTKAELLRYLRDSFDYGNRVLATINADNVMMRVEGPYAGPNTRLGMTVTAVWHLADHFGQLVEYARMNGIVPPQTQQYPLPVR